MPKTSWTDLLANDANLSDYGVSPLQELLKRSAVGVTGTSDSDVLLQTEILHLMLRSEPEHRQEAYSHHAQKKLTWLQGATTAVSVETITISQTNGRHVGRYTNRQRVHTNRHLNVTKSGTCQTDPLFAISILLLTQGFSLLAGCVESSTRACVARMQHVLLPVLVPVMSTLRLVRLDTSYIARLTLHEAIHQQISLGLEGERTSNT